MDAGYRTGLGHPYTRQFFNPIETGAANAHLNPWLLLLALVLIYIWWRTMISGNSLLGRQAAQATPGTEMHPSGYGSRGYTRL